jgi:hypothetical protein
MYFHLYLTGIEAGVPWHDPPHHQAVTMGLHGLHQVAPPILAMGTQEKRVKPFLFIKNKRLFYIIRGFLYPSKTP